MNDSLCLAFTNQSGKATINPPTPMVYKVRNTITDIDDAPKIKTEKLVNNSKTSQKSIVVEEQAKNDKEKVKEVKLVLKTILQPPPLFPLRLK